MRATIYAGSAITQKGGIDENRRRWGRKWGRPCASCGVFAYICLPMKRWLLIVLLLVAALPAKAGYRDDRNADLDSLEQVVAAWTPEREFAASDEEVADLQWACMTLMRGYATINFKVSEFYARKALPLSRRLNRNFSELDCLRYLGLGFYGREQYDSAQFYYNESLRVIDKMEQRIGGSGKDDENYTERIIDDARSMMYATLGNLYNMMGDIPQAMEYYGQAGEIFEKYGWLESCSVLHYNIGETWMEQDDSDKAEMEYEKALSFALEAGDSLCMASAWKGLGRVCLSRKQPRKALQYLREADAYLIHHQDTDLEEHKEVLEYIQEAQDMQRKQLYRLIVAIVAGAVVVILLLLLWRRKHAKAVVKKPVTTDITLSDREKEILALIAAGKTNREIADLVFLSPETVKWHRRRLLAKFEVANTAELIHKASGCGLI